MTTSFDAEYTDLTTLAAVIARSQIVVRQPVRRRALPPGFDEIDAAILDWIAAEGRRAARVCLPL